VVASNSIGPSLSANASFTTSGAVIVTPVAPVTPIVPPVTPVAPVIPEEPIEEPVLPQKPVVIKVPVATNVTAVLANNIPVLNGVRVTAPILFAPNSSSLSKSSIAQLASLAKSFEKQNGQLLVTGFVFYTNVSKATMKKVATARAKAVSTQLAKLGIKVTIGYLGYGPHNTKAPTPKDRKVELRWVAAK
jgi:outer membrane protein OmpA-like peptidoglycan-associated protein